jgi:bifunctional non-homologous end joining protein LigD
MMANSATEPFDNPNWIFEPKLDGYRTIAVVDERGSPHLWSRNGLTLEIKFPGALKAVAKLKLRSTILDGEIVAIDGEGISRFQLLQKWQKQASAPLAYYLFDVLWTEGMDVTAGRVLERRRRLTQIVSEVPGVQGGSYLCGMAWQGGKELFSSSEGARDGGDCGQAQRQHLLTREAILRVAQDQSTAPARIRRRRI